MKFNLQVKSAYNELKTKKDNSGKFYKTLFHTIIVYLKNGIIVNIIKRAIMIYMRLQKIK